MIWQRASIFGDFAALFCPLAVVSLSAYLLVALLNTLVDWSALLQCLLCQLFDCLQVAFVVVATSVALVGVRS